MIDFKKNETYIIERSGNIDELKFKEKIGNKYYFEDEKKQTRILTKNEIEKSVIFQ